MTERVTESKSVQIPGYQEISISKDHPSVFDGVFFFLGDSFVAFTPEQWKQFQKTIAEFN